ncbi:MAG TPA: serine hydrolase domain-containing protein [Thermoanaerobaculia bacterium]|jgi:hypothetical protein
MRFVPLLLLLATTLSAQSPAEVQAILQPIAKSGLAAAVARTDGLISVGGKASRVPIGSIAEPVTATILGTLVDEGFITWETTVANVFPEWRGSIRPEYANVTLVQLLSHEGRIPTSNAPVQEVLTLEPLPAVRKQYDWSPASQRIAMAIAEKITGQKWDEIVRERVLQAFEVKGTTDLSIEDLAKFARSHLVALQGHDSIVKAGTARLLHDKRNKIALGWDVQTVMSYAPISVASGSAGKSHTLIAVAPKQNLAIAVIANSESVARKALESLILAYAPPLLQPAPRRPIPPPRRPRVP